MNAGELALRGTVWLALTAWAAAEVCGQSRGARAKGGRGEEAAFSPAPFLPCSPATGRAWRVLWSFGALALAAHLALAMHLHHGWSHAAAVADTARQTQAKFGLNWGGGVWFNYALVVLWLTDAVWAWVSPLTREIARGWRWSVRGYLLFMWFNGAVVFPTGPVRWFGLVACVAVVGSWWRGRRPLT